MRFSDSLPRCGALFAALSLLPATSYAQPGGGGGGGLPPLRVPAGNPITAAKADLGKALFWDEQLSSTKTVACATCHMPESGGADPRTSQSLHPGADGIFGTADDIHGSPGVIANRANGTYRPHQTFPMREQVTDRKAPSTINAAFNPLQFWDGRSGPVFVDPVTGLTVLGGRASLETQAAGPPLSDVEMAHSGEDWTSLATEIAAARPLALASDVPAALANWLGTRGYPALFNEAFGSPAVTPARILMAIATYERTLISNQAPIDRFLAGQQNALTQQEQRGRNIFNNAGRCNRCHGGPLQTNQQFFNIGVRPTNEDLGRGAITGNPADNGAFKVPSLRNVGLRDRFFHTGGETTLNDVVQFYARGGNFRRNQTPIIQPFQISPQDRAALVAFLTNALTDPRVAAAAPPFDHPTLYADSGRAPVSYGFGSVGLGGLPARLVVNEPAVLGNASFTIGLADAHAGAPAVLFADVQSNPSGLAVPGIPVWLAGTAALVAIDLGRLQGTGATGGFTSFAAQLPIEPSLAGSSFFVQGAVVDAGAPSNLSVTGGEQITLFASR